MFVSKNEEVAVRARDEETDVPALWALAQSRDIEVLAMRSYCERDGVVLLLVTNNVSKTLRILETVGYQCSTRPIVLVGPLDRRGWGARLEDELDASGIRIHYSYAHRTENGQHFLAFKTEEDERAVRTLQVSAVLRNVVRAQSVPEEFEVVNQPALHESAA